MHQFKVGDRVKVVKTIGGGAEAFMGKCGVIHRFHSVDEAYQYDIIVRFGIHQCEFAAEELALDNSELIKKWMGV